jgi:hypothetical protein
VNHCGERCRLGLQQCCDEKTLCLPGDSRKRGEDAAQPSQ